ncbi:MAG: BON domain-containing protein [Hydrogenophaga sp.]|uniref:BON domain-containing protein n=1 Tax=Hydrogenophaga sp. TaxID=1904254 RepID=UPI001DE77C47|nr:BON domain-containing protein [Hydrogenophaga sp.]MBX3609453.1 BON domain-containing protein [Hydrogenophaga sp.]
MKRNLSPTARLTALVAALSASALVVACGEKEDATVGQQLDRSVEQVQSAGTQVRNDAEQAVNNMKTAGSEAADAIARGAADATITAKVNAALAADDQLKAMDIDVDTTNGRVALIGTAPNTQARERATTLAKAVDGVIDVDNRLTIDAQS